MLAFKRFGTLLLTKCLYQQFATYVRERAKTQEDEANSRSEKLRTLSVKLAWQLDNCLAS